MDLSPIALAKILLPRVPLLLKTALFNTLSLSPNASKQDLRTELTVALVRALISRKVTIGHAQRLGLKDPGIRGPMWVAKVIVTKPEEEDVREAIVQAIAAAGDGGETYMLPDLAAVEAEWTGYRSGVAKDAPQPNMTEEEKYRNMMTEVRSPTTILYFHGGAYFMMDPASHRGACSQLARLTKGRCFNVRYRLAPQNPFPAAILDSLVAYLSLLLPPPGALHDAVKPEHIIFAGDSAGGNLSLSLLQTLLILRRAGIERIRFHGEDVPISLPGGVTGNSPWCDIARSSPSIFNNAHLDYLNPPSPTGSPSSHPPDDLWPAKPPRAELYCDASMLTHPMVSPLAAGVDLWKGAPPVYVCVGNEGLEDEVSIVARRIFQAGVPIVFDGYEGMPHCFVMLFAAQPAGRNCYATWAGFMTDAVEGTVKKTEKGTWMKAFSNPPKFSEIRLDNLSPISDEEVDQRLRDTKETAVKRERGLQEQWHTTQSKSKL